MIVLVIINPINMCTLGVIERDRPQLFVVVGPEANILGPGGDPGLEFALSAGHQLQTLGYLLPHPDITDKERERERERERDRQRER